MTDTTPRPPATRPPLVRAVCALVLGEALVLLAASVGLVVALARGTDLPGPVAFMAALALGLALLLAAAARGLWRGSRWARSPVMTWQILLVVLAIGWLGVEVTWWSALVLAVAVVVAVGLLLPPVVAWTTTAVPGPSGPGTAASRR